MSEDPRFSRRTRRYRKKPIVISKQRKSTRTFRPTDTVASLKKFASLSSPTVVAGKVVQAAARTKRELALDAKSRKLWRVAEAEKKKKIAAEKKRQELARIRVALMKKAKEKGVKLRTDYTALYRKKG